MIEPFTLLADDFFNWISERHAIYQRRLAGKPSPWTDDPVMQTYKFTNPFRENDRVTVWMRENFTKPNSDRPIGEIIFNCCFFRMFGTIEMAQSVGWIRDWNPELVRAIARKRLDDGERVFTGAYIITNQGLTDPKENVVVDRFLTPLWRDRHLLANNTLSLRTLEGLHKLFREYQGWGGGGFMAYEVVTDLNHTSVLQNAKDRMTWANAGPGAKRGLNRLLGLHIDTPMKAAYANERMQHLLIAAPKKLKPNVPIEHVDMRVIEHSLCEFDKWCRTKNGEGKPRSRFTVDLVRASGDCVKGPIP